jgi:hypothetical protein
VCDAGGVEIRWTASWPDENDPVFRVGRRGDKLVAEWVGFARLVSNREGTMSELVAEPGVDPALVEKLRDGEAEALLRHLRGGVTLHAGAAVVDGVAVALLGDSGAGKSTMVAALCDVAGSGFVSDDMLIVEAQGEVVARGGDRASWVTRDTAAALGHAWSGPHDKMLVDRKTGSDVRLGAIACLAFGEKVRATPVTGRAAFEWLSKSMLRFVVDEGDVVVRDMDALSRIAAKVPVVRLERRRGLDVMRQDLADIVGALGASTRRPW